MMSTSGKVQDELPGEIEALLPWFAAGTLKTRDMRRVEKAVGADPALSRHYVAIQQEYAATMLINEALGAPSSRAMHKLFAAIDAEPACKASAPVSWSGPLAFERRFQPCVQRRKSRTPS